MLVFFLFKVMVVVGLLVIVGFVMFYGDVMFQEVDIGSLFDLGKEVLMVNLFCEGNEYGDKFNEVVKVGKSGYVGNCVVCYGIEVMFGGLIFDLREFLEWDDEYFIGCVMNGIG